MTQSPGRPRGMRTSPIKLATTSRTVALDSFTGSSLLLSHCEGAKHPKQDYTAGGKCPILRSMRIPCPLLLVTVLLASCGGGTRKLDEAIFHQGPQFTLKLTRYFENIPLHYVGEVYRVHCGSAATANSPAHKT